MDGIVVTVPLSLSGEVCISVEGLYIQVYMCVFVYQIWSMDFGFRIFFKYGRDFCIPSKCLSLYMVYHLSILVVVLDLRVG